MSIPKARQKKVHIVDARVQAYVEAQALLYRLAMQLDTLMQLQPDDKERAKLLVVAKHRNSIVRALNMALKAR